MRGKISLSHAYIVLGAIEDSNSGSSGGIKDKEKILPTNYRVESWYNSIGNCNHISRKKLLLVKMKLIEMIKVIQINIIFIQIVEFWNIKKLYNSKKEERRRKCRDD